MHSMIDLNSFIFCIFYSLMVVGLLSLFVVRRCPSLSFVVCPSVRGGASCI